MNSFFSHEKFLKIFSKQISINFFLIIVTIIKNFFNKDKNFVRINVQ